MKMRKIISLLLALVMVCSVIPMAVFAEGENTTVTTEIKTYAAAKGWTNEKQYKTVEMDSVITVTAEKTASTNNNTGKYYTNGHEWRVYQTETPKITVSAAEGATIVSVKFTYNVKNGGVLTNGSTKVSSKTVISVDAPSIVLGVGNTGSATNGQVKITNIEVTYTTGSTSGGEDPAPEVPDEPTVEYAEIKDGTYLFVTDGKAMSNLTQDKTYGYPGYANVTVTDGVATGYANTDLFTITNVEGGFTIQDSYGRYYYLSGTYNSFNVSANMPTEGHIWQAEVTEGGVLIVNVLKEKTLAYSAQYTSFGIYADQSSVMTLVAASAITEPEEPEVPEVPEVEYAEIADGTYLFVTDGKAMSNLAQDKNYGYPGYANVTVTDGVATGYANTDLFTITNVEGGFTIQDSYGRYYYLSGTYNSFNVSANMPTEGHIWQAEVTEGGVLIVNVLKEKTLAYSAQYTSFGIYADQSSVMTLVAASAITEPDEPEVPENNDPEADSTLTIEEANALGATKDHNTYTEGKYYVTGIISEVYSDTYGNMYIVDEDGNVLHVYGTFDADGTNRYDAMEVKPVAGDTVKVYGVIGQYNGKPQMKNAWIVEHTPAETEDDDNTGDTSAGTGDFGFIALVSLMAVSGTALVVLKKKEF